MAKPISEIEFEKLIYENQALIIKVCNIYCRTQADKDDLFQDITINLWKGLPSYQGQAKLSTWIYRVGLNTAISRARKAKRNQLFFTEKIPETAAPGPEDKNDEAYLIKALYAGIEQLKPLEKAIILLYLEDRSYEEMAEIIGMTKGNVSVRLVRLKRKLKKLVKPYMEINI